MRFSLSSMVLVLSTLSLLAGCDNGGGGAGGTGGGTGGTGGVMGGKCGDASQGDSCAIVGEKCTIDEGCGGEWWECTSEHRWSVTYYDDLCCGVTPCPATPPNEGEGCTPCYPACQWEAFGMCGNLVVDATCGDDWVWHVTAASSCDCSAYETKDACNADPKCRYLAPDECNDPTFTAAACHPKEDCSADNPCAAGKTCTQVTANDTDCDLPCDLCKQMSLCL